MSIYCVIYDFTLYQFDDWCFKLACITTLASVTCLIFNFHLKNKKRPTNTLLMMMKVAGFGVGEGEDAVFLPSKKLNGLEEVQNDQTNPKQSENCL